MPIPNGHGSTAPPWLFPLNGLNVSESLYSVMPPETKIDSQPSKKSLGYESRTYDRHLTITDDVAGGIDSTELRRETLLPPIE